MDRVSPKLKFRFGVFILALGWMPFSSAFSDTVFMPVDQHNEDPRQGPVEQFPESRFGMPPMRVTTGVDSHYASRAVNDMEMSDEADAMPITASGDGNSRSPASMDFGSGHVVRKNRPSAPSRNLAPGRALEQTWSGSVTTSAASSGGESMSSSVSRHGVQEVALIASDLGFFPRTVFVSRDVPVRLFVTGSSKNTLCIMMDSFQIRKQVRSQKIEEITFTPATPGKYRFYCPVNGMEGTLIVKELSSDAPAASGVDRSVARVSNPE